MPLVAGVDSSTQSCKVVIRDAETGALVRQGRAPHPDGTEVDPDAWWQALRSAVDQAGGLADVAAISVAGQQHGMVCLDEDGRVVRPALLWNDTRSADAAADLVEEAGGGAAGRRFWAEAAGSVPVASFTVTKLRWLATHEPEQAARVAAVCLPHDWLTWRLAGAPGLDALRTDRGDASGTGYWSPATGDYRPDLLERGFGRRLVVPEVLGPAESAGKLPTSWVGRAARCSARAPGTTPPPRSASAPARVTWSSRSAPPAPCSASPTCRPPTRAAPSPGFADASGRFLPLVCTLNAARVLDAAAALLGVRPGRAGRAGALRAGRRGRAGHGALPGGRADAEPAARHRRGARPDPAHVDPRAPGPGRRGGHALRARRRPGRADRAGCHRPPGHPGRRRGPVGRGASDRARRSSAARSSCRRPGSTSPTAPPGRPPGSPWAAPTPPVWAVEGTEEYAAEPVPAVRDQYAAARGLVLDRR